MTLYYHMVGETFQFDMKDMRPEKGQAVHILRKEKIKQGWYGLHACVSPLSALSFAPANAKYICEVEIGNIYDSSTSDNAVVSDYRKIVNMIPCENMLIEFADACLTRAYRDYKADGKPHHDYAGQMLMFARLDPPQRHLLTTYSYIGCIHAVSYTVRLLASLNNRCEEEEEKQNQHLLDLIEKLKGE